MKDYVALAVQYQAQVLDGTIPACSWVQLACARNRKDLDRQQTAAFPYRFDPEAARRICQMAELLPHIEGPKAKQIGVDDQGRALWATIQLEPWQCWIFTTLFGWKHQTTGVRRFRVSLILVPRGNGKSVMGAIVSLYMLTADGESGAQCYSLATTRDQAKIVAKTVWEMTRRSPQFRDYFGVKMGAKTTRVVEVPATASVFMPLSADANSLDGLNTHCAVIDELHAHKRRDVYDVTDTSLGKRSQSLLAAITTAGVEIGGICHEKLGYLEKVLDSVIVDEHFFGTNYTIDPGDEVRIHEPVIQRKANPNYGVSVEPDKLAQEIKAAQLSPAALNNVLTKHFNVWIRTESAWMTATLWQTCAKLGLTIEDLKKFPCWIGVDLAEVRDIAALVAVFQLAHDSYAVIGRFYLPTDTIIKSPIAQLSGWVREWFIIETPGNQADFGRIQADIIAWCKVLNVREIDFDRALAAQMQQQLMEHFEPQMGRDAAQKFIITVPQRVEEMDPAMKLTERLVLSQKLQHDGNPAMAWMIANVVVERNYKDEIYPRKAGGKDSANKIDGPVAMWTALSQAMKATVPVPQYQMLVIGGTKA